jgi:hypothetical protein
MSKLFAIAGVTAVLRDLLNNGVIDGIVNSKGGSPLGNVLVTAQPPDRIKVDEAGEKPQLNLYMYQVTPNSGWRNIGLPSRSSTGERLSNPPLAIDLHYLVSAYGPEEFHTDALLGYAMYLLHETPVLTRRAIRTALNPLAPNPPDPNPPDPNPPDPNVNRPVSGMELFIKSNLAEQIEQIKITPHYLSAEEISKLWMAFQAKYRPSAAYQVSVLLIDNDQPAHSPLPVLKIGEEDRGPIVIPGLTLPFPSVEKIELPNNQVSALVGDEVKIAGTYLTGDFRPEPVVNILLSNASLGQTVTIDRFTSNNTQEIVFNLQDNVPAGLWMLSVVVIPKDDQNIPQPDRKVASIEVPFLVAPKIETDLKNTTFQRSGITNNLGNATIDLDVSPWMQPQQRIKLALGSTEVAATPFEGETEKLTFTYNGIAAGTYRIRLTVDGVESHLINRTDPVNPTFDEKQVIVIA